MSQEQFAKRIESRDGTRLVGFASRDDSLFSLKELSLVTEDGYTFWTPAHGSGLYDALDAAEREARAAPPWLRDQF